ncbi:DoxX family protein [Actinokineospora sp. HUAS TT18]|uniref:DoxX family protein n=1 Tax=Actinokineospora sp. HUAS TT18 TaxID=3447451 RepID=UPI003F51FC1E
MLLRRLARPMLAAIFIGGGLESLRDPAAHAEQAKPLLDKLPGDAHTLVRLDGAVKVGAGAALALGRFPKASAVLLFASLVPTTLGAHQFWAEKDAAVAKQEQVHFAKNLGLLGGLLLAVIAADRAR